MAQTHADPQVEARPAYLGHHYENVEQQFQSGKLGMWLFLATEILLFAGLFCAYAVYRHNHPEIFLYAHHFLDVKLGGINTIVLIFSSLTMAMGVRCAQKGQRGLLILNLMITFACACGFLGIKYVEYKHKFEHGLLWGTLYQSQDDHGTGHGEEETHPADDSATGTDATGTDATGTDATGTDTAHAEAAPSQTDHASEEGATDTGTSSPDAVSDHGPAPSSTRVTTAQQAIELARSRSAASGEGGTRDGPVAEPSVMPRAVEGPGGLASELVAASAETAPYNPQIFFGIYFVMTGLHGIHVIIGMIVIGWLIVRSFAGHFGPDYFTPVDLGGLYWHIVDLIWIYLFPLLYLIH
jgi:cytochrome c oxidase subunit 3